MAMQDEMTNWKGKLASYRSEVLMVLVVILTAIAIWMVPADKEEAPPSLPQLPALRPEVERPPSAAEVEGAAALRGGDRARVFIARLRADSAEPDAGVVFAEAERLQSEGNLDDAYLLYRFAARQGHAQAALIVGTLADPAYHTATRSYLPEPKPEQAYKWYSVAAAAGNEEAELRLHNLRNQVQQAATAGDEQAQRLMLQWR
ncbi:MAG: deoxyribonuclease [Pseudomonadota bacterium]